MARIGLFGGSFDPIHAAHLMIAEFVRVERALDRVVFIPAKAPPHKPGKIVAPAEHRLEMVRLAIRDNPYFEASDIELKRDGASYTLLTVREQRRNYPPETELYFIVGGDMLHDLPSWYHAEELVREIDFIAVDRPGHELGDMAGLERAFGRDAAERIRRLAVPFPQIDLSSTIIRQRAREGKSIRYMVPESVRDYVTGHGLYR